MSGLFALLWSLFFHEKPKLKPANERRHLPVEGDSSTTLVVKKSATPISATDRIIKAAASNPAALHQGGATGWPGSHC